MPEVLRSGLSSMRDEKMDATHIDFLYRVKWYIEESAEKIQNGCFGTKKSASQLHAERKMPPLYDEVLELINQKHKTDSIN